MSEKVQKKMIRTTLRCENTKKWETVMLFCFVFEATTGKAAQVQQFRYSSVFAFSFTRQ